MLRAGSFMAGMAISLTSADSAPSEYGAEQSNPSIVRGVDEILDKTHHLIVEGQKEQIRSETVRILNLLPTVDFKPYIEHMRNTLSEAEAEKKNNNFILKDELLTNIPFQIESAQEEVDEINTPEESSNEESAQDFSEPESQTVVENREDCEEIRGEAYNSQEERTWFLENCIEESASAPSEQTLVENTPQNVAPSTPSGKTVIAPITGYYCEQIPGYPVGDGGGWCGITASGAQVAPGMAACGYNWNMGDVLHIQGHGNVVCTDRGHLNPNQVDVFYQNNAGLYGDLANGSLPTQAEVTKIE